MMVRRRLHLCSQVRMLPGVAGSEQFSSWPWEGVQIMLVDITQCYNRRIFAKWHLSPGGIFAELLMVVKHSIFWEWICRRLDAQAGFGISWLLATWVYLTQIVLKRLLGKKIYCKVKYGRESWPLGLQHCCLIVCHNTVVFFGEPQWGYNDNLM